MFDVIIPTYNNLNELRQCLEGFKIQTFKNFRILICVDGSTDGTREHLSTAKYPFEYLAFFHPGNKNRGRSATRNLALPHLKNEFAIFIDSDIFPDKLLLEEHLNALKSRDCVSIGKIIYLNAENNIWADYIHQRGANKCKNLRTIPYRYFTTGNTALRSVYIKKLKGFDEELTGYGGEDTVFGFLLNKNFNLPLINNAKSKGYSFMNKSHEIALKQAYEFGANNLKIIRRKYPEFKNIFRLDLFEGSFIKLILEKIVFNPVLLHLFKFFMQTKVKFIRRFSLRYLTQYNIIKGLKS